MSLRNPRRLSVEGLESRITPAVTVKFVAGNLFIKSDNLSNTLTILENAAGKFTVTNNTKFVGTYQGINNLSVAMGNGNDDVTLKVQTLLPGNLSVSLGNGYDRFSTIPSAGPATARIGGSVLVNTGLTSVRPVTMDPLDQYDELLRLYNLRIGGNVTVIGSAGNGTGIADNQNSRIGGVLTVVNVSTITMGNTADKTLFSTAAAVSISNVQKNTDNRNQPAGEGNGFYMFGGSSISGGLQYTGGGGEDSVFLPSGPDNGAGVTIGGNVSASLGNGINTLQLGNGTSGATVGGSVTYSAGADDDRILFDSGSVINGNLFVSLNGGNNQLFGDSIGLGQSGAIFDPLGTATVGGNATFVLGNGNNFIGTYSAALGPASLSVAGNLSFTVGNGTTTGGAAAAPGVVQFFNTDVTVGGTASYRAGTGTNNLTVTNETIQALRIVLSGGPSTVLFNQASGFFNGSLFLDFGTGFGPKTLGGTAAFGGPVTIVNYP